MGIKFKNNAFGTLASGITNVQVSITLGAGQGARFPVLAAGDYFYSTLVDAAANIEIIKVTARATDTLTAVRAQDGTAGRAYLAGDRLELRPCNVALLALIQESDAITAAAGSGTYTATLDPVPTGYNTNQVYEISFASSNTAASPTLNLNALGAKTLKRLGGGTIGPGEIPAGLVGSLLYNGTDLILLNTPDLAVVAAGTDTYTATLSPAAGAYQTDRLYQITFTNANLTPAPTLNLNGLGAKTIKGQTGSALIPGSISAGMRALLQYNGTDFLLINSAASPIPVGTILDYGGTAAPAGYLACDGAAVSRTTYSSLFAAISTTWGIGDGSTTFNVPDLSRRVTVGSGGTLSTSLGNVVGNTGGADTLTVAQLAAHSHTVTDPMHSHTVPLIARTGTSGSQMDGAWNGGSTATTSVATGVTIANAGSGAAFNPPSAVVLKIIKT